MTFHLFSSFHQTTYPQRPNYLICSFMAFTDIYNTVLTPFLKKFKDAENEKVKKTILKNASEAVIKSRDTMEVKGDLPKDLEKVHFFLCSIILSFHLIFAHFRQSVAISKPPLASPLFQKKTILNRQSLNKYTPYGMS